MVHPPSPRTFPIERRLLEIITSCSLALSSSLIPMFATADKKYSSWRHKHHKASVSLIIHIQGHTGDSNSWPVVTPPGFVFNDGLQLFCTSKYPPAGGDRYKENLDFYFFWRRRRRKRLFIVGSGASSQLGDADTSAEGVVIVMKPSQSRRYFFLQGCCGWHIILHILPGRAESPCRNDKRRINLQLFGVHLSSCWVNTSSRTQTVFNNNSQMTESPTTCDKH